MGDIPDSVIHWLLASSVPVVGGLFVYLIKRTFHEFETKIATVFAKLEDAINKANNQHTEIELVKQRLDTLERKRRR